MDNYCTIKFIKEHECTRGVDGIGIEKYSIGDAKRWYFNSGKSLHGIKYCPYCGKNLYEEG